jgi:hypothetical protein
MGEVVRMGGEYTERAKLTEVMNDLDKCPGGSNYKCCVNP